MAQNYLQFSFQVDCNAEEREWLLKTLNDPETLTDITGDELEVIEYESKDGGIWFFADEYGSPESIVAISRAWLIASNLAKEIQFSWSSSCSKLRLNEFDGGSVFLTKDVEIWSHAVFHQAVEAARRN